MVLLSSKDVQCFGWSKALEHCHSERYRNGSLIKSSLLVSQIWQRGFWFVWVFLLFFGGGGGGRGCVLAGFVLFIWVFFYLRWKDRLFSSFFIIILDIIYVSYFLNEKRIIKQLCNNLRAIINDTLMSGFGLPFPILPVITR